MPQPNKIPKAFAASGDRNIIPESTGTLGLASWNEGFPAITSVPFAEGGLAPKRADFNGIFNALSAATVWQQQGGIYEYDNSTDYEVGNVVLYSGNLYKCITANGPSSVVKAPTDATVWDLIMPASGGTFTGNLSFSQSSARLLRKDSSGDFRVLGGTSSSNGSFLTLTGKDSSSSGSFSLTAHNGTDSKVLVGRANGTLTWDGNNVITAAGGTITGTLYTKDIYIDNASIRTRADTQPGYFYGGVGWRHGAQFAAYGKDDSVNPGYFSCRADNGTDFKVLMGTPNGALVWDGKNVVTDYFSGTFTPTMYGSTTTGSFTYSSQKGNYIKIGGLCYVSLEVAGTVVTAPTGNVSIGGLPYAASDTEQSILINIIGDNGRTTNAPLWMRMSAIRGAGGLWGVNSSGELASTRWATLSVGTSVAFRFSGIYRTA